MKTVNSYIQSFLQNLPMKEFNFENRSTFAEVMIKSQVWCFLRHSAYVVSSFVDINELVLCFREKDRQAKCIIEMNGPTTFIRNPDQQGVKLLFFHHYFRFIFLII